MKLLKPNWVHHNENSIFSIDVHPDSSRFATGGQGPDSGKIVIWNMAPVIDNDKENDENSPRILCQMDHHIACVNVVRWSNNGLFLASGSDDKLVMIWQYAAKGISYQMENWKCSFTLRGHSGDVMDLAWSAKDQYLATCSVDNTVIIWDALKFPDIIRRINAHGGLVKGVAWDPVGTYFASQSDDKTLKVWRTLDWSLEKCVDEPFKNCAGTTHVLRCNWSPDGQLVVSAHAMNNGAPTAQVIDRGNKWNTKLDFVGHRKAVTAVRFFPSILKPATASKQDTADIKTHCLFALGSRDRSISIWLTNYSRPLCVIRDLFDNPIMDLSWSKSPNPGLLACSMDGTVSYVEFDYSEIGLPQTPHERAEFFMKKYSHDINASVSLKSSNLNMQNNIPVTTAANNKKNDTLKFVENIDILMAQEQKQKQTALAPISENSMSQNPMNNSFTNHATTPGKIAMLTEVKLNNKQIETKMSDGRRRITPICVSKPGEYDTPKPFGSSDLDKVGFERSIGFGSPESKFCSKSATEQSAIIIEKRNEQGIIVECSPVKSIIYTKSNSNQMIATNSNEQITQPDKVAQAEPVAKKNLDYSSVTFNSIGPSKIPAASTPTLNGQNTVQKIKTTSSALANKQPQTQTPSQSVEQLNRTPVASKQKVLPKPVAANSSTRVQLTQQEKVTPVKESTAVNKPKIVTPGKSSHHHEGTLSYHVSQNVLAPLKIEKNFITKTICERSSTRSALSLEIHNSISLTDNSNALSNSSSAFSLSLVKYVSDYNLKWQIYFATRICEVACSSQLVAVACADSTLHLIKASNGSQLCCPIILDSRAAVLKCNMNYCMCLTVHGSMYVWKYKTERNTKESKDARFKSDSTVEADINNLATIINRQSCHSILKDGAFTNALLTDHGIPVIYMSKNRSYFFSLQTQCWHQVPAFGNMVGDGSHLLFNSSSSFADHAKSINSLKGEPASSIIGPLSIIQQRDKSSNILKTIDLMNKTSIIENPLFNRQDFTLTHLESQVNASIGLSSPKEYKFWMMTYARYLIENDYEEKLTDLCNFLLGPLYSLNWTETVLTFKKHDLLKEILTVTAQNLQLQRLYSYYKQQLTLATNITSKSNILNRLTAPSSRQFDNSNRTRCDSPVFLKPTSVAPEAIHLRTKKSIDLSQSLPVGQNNNNEVTMEETDLKTSDETTGFDLQKNEEDISMNEITDDKADAEDNDAKEECPTSVVKSEEDPYEEGEPLVGDNVEESVELEQKTEESNVENTLVGGDKAPADNYEDISEESDNACSKKKQEDVDIVREVDGSFSDHSRSLDKLAKSNINSLEVNSELVIGKTVEDESSPVIELNS